MSQSQLKQAIRFLQRHHVAGTWRVDGDHIRIIDDVGTVTHCRSLHAVRAALGY